MSKGRASEKAFPEEEPEFQVAPMIDILLVLMTFFMSITSAEVIKTQPKIENFNLAVAKDSLAAEQKRSEVVVNVGWDPAKKGQEGILVFEDRFYKEPGDLSLVIQQRRETLPPAVKGTLRAVLRVSEQVPYSFVQQVMMACADANVANITFAVYAKDIPKEYAK